MTHQWFAGLTRAATTAVVCVTVLASGCGEKRPRPEHAVAGSKLTLRGFTPVPNSDVFRAALSDASGGYTSGYQTRNVLFVEASGEARWLLPDDDHSVKEHPVTQPGKASFDPESPPVAIVALAMPLAADTKVGDLYLYEPTGERASRIAEGVAEVHGVALRGTSVAILYERVVGYVLGHYDLDSLTKISETKVAVPTLK